MDIALLSDTSLKIKIKKTSLIVDPKASIVKTEADAIIALNKDIDPTRVSDYRVLINGRGEYEVGGLKISASKAEDDTIFCFGFENSEAVLSNASSLSKIPQDKIKEYSIAIINADSEINQSIITAMEPRYIVLYGEKKEEAAKSLGALNLLKNSKINISEDKLPEETEIFILG